MSEPYDVDGSFPFGSIRTCPIQIYRGIDERLPLIGFLDVKANFLGVNNLVARFSKAKGLFVRLSIQRLGKNSAMTSQVFQDASFAVIQDACSDGGGQQNSRYFVFLELLQMIDGLPPFSIPLPQLRKCWTGKKD